MLYDGESGDISIALTGETFITRRLSVFKEPQYLKLIQMLSDADVSFAAVEGSFLDHEVHPFTFAGGQPRFYAKGTYMASPPWCIKELQRVGIKMVALSNNHNTDYGEEGLLNTIKNMDSYGMPFAGIGKNLRDARSPVYLETNHGRVALLAAAAWGPRERGEAPWAEPMGIIAAERSPHSPGRPGINVIRHRMVYTLDQESFANLRHISKQLGHEEGARHRARQDDRKVEPNLDSELYFQDGKFLSGKEFSSKSVADPVDLAENLKWVRDARRMADWVMFSYHDHGYSPTAEVPGQHHMEVAHAVIDNGADVFIGTGPHRDRGIEIYKGKPIFHALGDFILQNDGPLRMPHENMRRVGLGWDNTPADFYDARLAIMGEWPEVKWETALAMLTFKARELAEIRLYPVDAGRGKPRGQAGRPILAEPGSELNKRVLERFQRMSERYGTKIEINDGIGIIRLG